MPHYTLETGGAAAGAVVFYHLHVRYGGYSWTVRTYHGLGALLYSWLHCCWSWWRCCYLPHPPPPKTHPPTHPRTAPHSKTHTYIQKHTPAFAPPPPLPQACLRPPHNHRIHDHPTQSTEFGCMGTHLYCGCCPSPHLVRSTEWWWWLAAAAAVCPESPLLLSPLPPRASLTVSAWAVLAVTFHESNFGTCDWPAAQRTAAQRMNTVYTVGQEAVFRALRPSQVEKRLPFCGDRLRNVRHFLPPFLAVSRCKAWALLMRQPGRLRAELRPAEREALPSENGHVY